MGHFARSCLLKRNENKNKRFDVVKYSSEGSAMCAGTKSENMCEDSFAVFKRGKTQESGVWVIDSGASSHMVWDKCVFRDYKEFDVPEDVYLCGSRVLRALETGSVDMSFPLPIREVFTTALTNVLYAPGITISLDFAACCNKEGKLCAV